MAFLHKLRSKRVALDIGGTLTKIAWLKEQKSDALSDFVKSYEHSEIHLADEYGEATILCGITKDIDYAQLSRLPIPDNTISVTGGGAHLYDREVS